MILSCAPPGYFIQPVFPTIDGKVHSEYRNLSAREVESLFVRPYTDRPLLETSGVSSALLFDYCYLEKINEGKSGAREALEGMTKRFVEEGISFRTVIWGSRMLDVDPTHFLFRLDLGDGTVLEPILVEPVGSPVAERRPADERSEIIWHSMTDITFPIQLTPPRGKVVLLVERGGVEYDRHTWKFNWEGK